MTTGSRRGQSKTLYRNKAKLGKIKNMLGINEAVELNSVTKNPDYNKNKYNKIAAGIDQMETTRYYIDLMGRYKYLLNELSELRSFYPDKVAEIAEHEAEVAKLRKKLELIYNEMKHEEKDVYKKYGDPNIVRNIGTQYQIDDYDEEGNPVENPKITGKVYLNDGIVLGDHGDPGSVKFRAGYAKDDGEIFARKKPEPINPEEADLKSAEVSMKQYQDEKEKEAKKKAKELAKFNNSRNLFNADSNKFEALEDDYLNQDFEDPEEDEEN